MAYVTFENPFPFPEPQVELNSWTATGSFASTALDAVGENVGYVFRSPFAGVIERICFRVASVASAGDLLISLEDVDVATGLPDAGADQTVTLNIATSGTKDSGEIVDGGGNKRTVAVGDYIAVRLKNVTGDYSISSGSVNRGETGNANFYNFSQLGGGAQAIATNQYGIGIKYVTQGWVNLPCTGPALNYGTYAFGNNHASTDEICSKWVAPFTCKVTGIYFGLDADGPFNFVLQKAPAYLDDKVSHSLTTPQRNSTAPGMFLWFFEEFEILKDEVWFINVRPSSTTAVSVGFLDVRAGTAGALKSPTANNAHTKNNGTLYPTGVAPTSVDNRYLNAGFLIKGIDVGEPAGVGSGSGSGLIQRIGL